MLLPVMPNSANKILESLHSSNNSFDDLAFGVNDEVSVTSEAVKLFMRLDVKAELEYHQKVLEEKQKALSKKIETKPLVSIEEFDKLDIRVGKVLECKKVEKSDKLLVFQIKVEDEVRQIVSGIQKYYKPEELVGKNVIFIANLKPAKIRGVESNGMILSCESSDGLEVIQVNSNEFSKVK